jgi:hypothetical protein
LKLVVRTLPRAEIRNNQAIRVHSPTDEGPTLQLPDRPLVGGSMASVGLGGFCFTPLCEANTAYDVLALAAEIRKARQRRCGLERQSAYLLKPKKAPDQWFLCSPLSLPIIRFSISFPDWWFRQIEPGTIPDKRRRNDSASCPGVQTRVIVIVGSAKG